MLEQAISDLISISRGNVKMGRTPSFSLPPIKSCWGKVPCKGPCYALRMAKRRPNVAAAWERNWACVQTDLSQTMNAISAWLTKHRPTFFRWHVAGDIPTPLYFEYIHLMAYTHEETQFLAFTKRRDMQSDILSYINLPNLTVRFSNFLSLRFDQAPLTATYIPKGVSPTGFVCPGDCMSCRVCWDQDMSNINFLHH